MGPRKDLDDGWIDATVMAGRALGSVELGVVAETAPADLLVFADDPRRDPAAYASLRAVVANGRYYDRQVLEDALQALALALGESPPDLGPRLAAPEGGAGVAVRTLFKRTLAAGCPSGVFSR